MENIIVKLLEELRILIKGITEIIKKEENKQKEGFLPMLFRKLVASLLGSELTGKGLIRDGEGVIRPGQNF